MERKRRKTLTGFTYPSERERERENMGDFI
jgi:hypothetical protein